MRHVFYAEIRNSLEGDAALFLELFGQVHHGAGALHQIESGAVRAADIVHPAIADHGKHRTVEEMVGQRIGDYEEFQAYMTAVFARVEAWLADLDPAELTRLVIPRPFPDQVASTYSARVAGPEGITLLDATECWIYQHGLRHMGEIELARGPVGLGGMTS